MDGDGVGLDSDTLINLIMMAIALFSAILSIYALHQSRLQYEEGQKPVISTILIVSDNHLKLLVVNHGKDLASNVKLSDFEIEDNGRFDCRDNEFESIVFDLYPEERVCRAISLYVPNMSYVPNPTVSFQLTYCHNGIQISQKRKVALCLE